jgi:glyoxylase-like metal-dependent hydrolase (beta-lactamase superfamily II)
VKVLGALDRAVDQIDGEQAGQQTVEPLLTGMKIVGSYVPALPPDHWLTDEQKVMLGQVPIVAIHTPGHTPGSISFYLPNDKLVLAGDTLFRGSIGRTDLWGGNFEAIEQSIRERLYTLDEATTVITGHGPDTEIGLEKESNQFVRV